MNRSPVTRVCYAASSANGVLLLPGRDPTPINNHPETNETFVRADTLYSLTVHGSLTKELIFRLAQQLTSAWKNSAGIGFYFFAVRLHNLIIVIKVLIAAGIIVSLLPKEWYLHWYCIRDYCFLYESLFFNNFVDGDVSVIVYGVDLQLTASSGFVKRLSVTLIKEWIKKRKSDCLIDCIIIEGKFS